jgi:putative FmdB family regulatory protein
MPMWTRHCDACDELFDVLCKFEDKDLPKECPYCGATTGEYMLAAPVSSIRPDRLMTAKKDGGFNEVLDRIKSRHGRTSLATGRNSGERAMD